MSGTIFSDPELLERLRTRDRTAWEQIVETYLPQLLRAGRGMGFRREENEDLAQSAFTALVEGLDRFEGRSHIRTYLFGIFHNKVCEHIREKYRAEECDSIDQVIQARFDTRGRWRQPPVDLDNKILRREQAEILQECLETLPAAQRTALSMREIQGMTTAEICNKIGVTTTNLGVLLFRARNRIRECVEKKVSRKGPRV
jgi:RNA polymerase sigma-70 factor, ECF subfamily